MKSITIVDPLKGKIKYDIENEMSIESFNKKLEIQSNNSKLQKAAEIRKATDKASGYQYVNKTDQWGKDREGFVYAITMNGKIVKIGMTEKSLTSRFSSYQAGTKAARNKGTCSVTNYYCSEAIRQALANDVKVEIHCYKVPTKHIITNVLGKEKKLVAKQAYAYEDRLLEIYRDNKGGVPTLCRNTSLV